MSLLLWNACGTSHLPACIPAQNAGPSLPGTVPGHPLSGPGEGGGDHCCPFHPHSHTDPGVQPPTPEWPTPLGTLKAHLLWPPRLGFPESCPRGSGLMGAWHTVGPRQHALLCKALSAVCSSSAGPPDSGSEPPPPLTEEAGGALVPACHPPGSVGSAEAQLLPTLSSADG